MWIKIDAPKVNDRAMLERTDSAVLIPASPVDENFSSVTVWTNLAANTTGTSTDAKMDPLSAPFL